MTGNRSLVALAAVAGLLVAVFAGRPLAQPPGPCATPPPLQAQVPVATPTGVAYDPITASFFVVGANPPVIAQVDNQGGGLHTASQNLNAVGYTNPLPLGAAPPSIPAMAVLALPVLVRPPSTCTSASLFPGVCPPYQPINPTGVALDFRSNTLYITDNRSGSNSRILVVSAGADGVLLTADDQVSHWFTAIFLPPLLSPLGITYSPLTRSLFVLDLTGFVYEISTSGVQNSVFGVPVAGPVGLAYDPTQQTVLVLSNATTGANVFAVPPAPSGSMGQVQPVAGTSQIPGAALTDLAYDTSRGVVFGLDAGAAPVPMLRAGAAPIAGPADAGTPLSPALGGIVSDDCASTGTGISRLGTTGPGPALLAPANAPVPVAPVVITITNFGVPPPPAMPLSNVYDIRASVTPTSFAPPITLTIPLLNPPQRVGRTLALFFFGPSGQSAGAPAAGLQAKSLGRVDPSGMTATFEAVNFLSLVTAIPTDVPPATQAVTLLGALELIVGRFGLEPGIERSLLAKLDGAAAALATPRPTVRRDAEPHLQALLNEANALKGRALTPEQSQTLTGSVQAILRIIR